MDPLLLLKVTHGEMTLIKANPLCAIAAFIKGMSCFLSPEKLCATKVAPSSMANPHKSMAWN